MKIIGRETIGKNIRKEGNPGNKLAKKKGIILFFAENILTAY